MHLLRTLAIAISLGFVAAIVVIGTYEILRFVAHLPPYPAKGAWRILSFMAVFLFFNALTFWLWRPE